MKRFVSIVLVAALVAAFAVPVVADTPFQGYTYNHWGALVPSPAAYAPTRMFDALMVDPTIGHFSDPTDIHVAPDGTILVTDRGNNRIVAFDAQLNLVFVLYGFYQDGVWQTFNRPHSAFVTRDFNIFIADTENFRIPILDWEGNLVREITAPTAEGLEDDFVFRPLQILVDRGGRTYVIVQNVFEGIMNFDHSGEFVGYFGTIEVGFNPLEFFWRLFMTETQIARQNRWIPTEFQSMALDQYNFVFTTNLEPWGSANQVMRLNPRGEDVLNNINDNVTIAGDQNFRSMGPLAGPSQLIDIIARPHGMFTALCQVRNRLYTYDNEGNLLYVFGGTGNILGMTSRPVAIEMLGEDILVLCAWTNRITQFSPT
jgi:DNA-binding beta-propeller fold protein YncE